VGLAGIMFFSFCHSFTRLLGPQETPLSLGLFSFVLSFLVLIPFVAADLSVPAMMHMPVFLTGGASFAAGLTFVSFGFRLAPPAVAAPFHYTQMIWGVIFGIFLFGDIPDFFTVLGASVNILSGLYLIYRENRDGKQS
jgi:drug/metabolite transporter (DMT)-like permease